MGKKIQRPTLVEACKLENVRLADDPNILSVGFGLRRRKGKIVEEVCLRYRVYSKYTNESEIMAAGSKPIPKEAHGYPTDVLLVKENRPSQCPEDRGAPTGDRGTRKENPLVGGTSTTVLSDWHSFPTGYGTLGGICFDRSTGDAMALSNAHVWGTEIGKDVIQPWMPIGEYIEAVVKLLTCGPAVSYILDTTIPSPLTAGLAAAAAGAWAAAIASDAEDPSRWGQRMSTVPTARAKTEAEQIHLEASLPDRPFAGRPYSTETIWDYTRITNQGSFSNKIKKKRQNEHVLIRKTVWTDRIEYRGGERINICAEVVTRNAANPWDYFVVAHCFPKANPERIVHRILIHGECKREESENKICFHGFPPPYKPRDEARFPFEVDIFKFDSNQSSIFFGPWPVGTPTGITVLRIPGAGIEVTFPASSKVVVELFHTNRPISAKAYSGSGQLLSTATTTATQGILQQLTLTGTEITSVTLAGGGGEGYMAGITIEIKKDKEEKRFIYMGKLDLDVREVKDKWVISLFVQTVNNVPAGTDSGIAAQTIGGVTVSSNIADTADCVVVMAADHVFDVI